MKKIIANITILGICYANTININKHEFLQTQKYMCDDGDAKACSVAGAIYSMEDFAKEYEVKVDYFTANKYLEKACDKNDDSGCFNLAISYDLGQGVTKDIKKAHELYKKACELNHANACYVVGGYLKDMEKNDKNSLEYYKKACKLKEKNACNSVGAILFNKDNLEEALWFFKKACEYGDNWGCKNANMIMIE